MHLTTELNKLIVSVTMKSILMSCYKHKH